MSTAEDGGPLPVRVVLRPVGTPLPPGFLALAGTGTGVLAGTFAVVGASSPTSPPSAVRGAPHEEVSAVAHEAGVREQL